MSGACRQGRPGHGVVASLVKKVLRQNMGSAATLAMMQALAMGLEDAAPIDAWGEEPPAEHVPRPPVEPRDVPRAAAAAAARGAGGAAGGIGNVGGVRRLQLSEKPAPRPPKARSHAGGPARLKADGTPRAGRSGPATKRRAARDDLGAARGTPRASKSERRRKLTEQARGGIKSARTPRLPRVKEQMDGPPKQCHVFLTRKSKGVPMKNPMPRLKAKASPLVAAINMHERGFEKRRVQYDAQRKRRLQEEIEEDALRRREEEERQRAKLVAMKKDRERALAEAFGDAEEFDPAELERLEDVLHEKNVKRKKKKAKQMKKKNKPKAPKPVPLTKEQKRERRMALAKQHHEKKAASATKIQAHFRAFVGRRVYGEVKRQEAVREQQERDDIVRTVVERMVNQVEMEGIDERENLLKQIEDLQEKNRKAINTIDKVLVASSKTDGSWAIPWPPPEIADHNDGPNFKDSVGEHNLNWAKEKPNGVSGARGFARLFIDRLLDDVVMPHAFERVVHRRKARTKAILEGKFGVHVQSVSDIMHQEMMRNTQGKPVPEPEPEPEPDTEPGLADVEMVTDDELDLNTLETLVEDRVNPTMTDAELEAAAETAIKAEAEAEAERMFELRKLAAAQGLSVGDIENAMGMLGENGAGAAAAGLGAEDPSAIIAGQSPAAEAAAAAAAAAQAAEREKNAAAAQEDPEVAEQARKLAEMMKVAEASGLVRSTHLAYSNQKPKWP